MTRFLLTVVLIAACALPCGAQTKEVIEEVDATLSNLRIAARHADERTEDVEILRRLLNKACGLPHGQEVRPYKQPYYSTALAPSGLGGMALTDSGITGPKPGEAWLTHSHTTAAAVGPFDGVYLKGAGVVYTLRVPAGAELTFDPHTQRVGVNAGCAKCHQDTPAKHASQPTAVLAHCTACHTAGEGKPRTEPLSEWEQARRQLRGETPAEAEPKGPSKIREVLCDPGSLAEQLAAQLSAHARQVRHLGEKESITVVVTFDALPGAKATTADPPATIGLTPDEVQALTLGDLHLKQKKYAEAVEAYLKGLVRFKQPIDLQWHSSHMTSKDANTAAAELQTGVRSAYKSLATAYLQLNQLEDAREAMGQAASYRFVNLIDVSDPGVVKRKPTGPAKLILSVTKADVAAKDAAALKKAVVVERLNFPPAAEKGAK